MFVQRACLLTLVSALGACAIHPLPEDVTGVKTATIVHKIRCEARDAVIQARIDYVRQRFPDVVDLATLRHRLSLLSAKDPIITNLNYFNNTGIVYSFSLDGTAMDSASVSADLIQPLTLGLGGSATLSPSASNALTRENNRTFTISDNFGKLVAPANDNYCSANGSSSPDYEYPIVGRVGVDEMVKTFIELTLRDLLAPKQDATAVPPAPNTPAPIAMVDTLTFTTTLSAGLTTKVAFTPGTGHNWHLMDAMLPLTVSRMDKHQVIIGLALAGNLTPPGTIVGAYGAMRVQAALASAPVLQAKVNNPQLIFATPSTSNGQTGEEAALQAVNAQILRYELPKAFLVAP